jgi:hypothetical protein
MTGNASTVYYAAYVFFEKERIAAGGKKSDHRLEMERTWVREGGVETKTNLNNVRYITSRNTTLTMDSFGKVSSF